MSSKMDRQVTIRCSAEDAQALEQLHAQLPDLSLAAVARVAMRKGLAVIAGDATKLINQAQQPEQPKRAA